MPLIPKTKKTINNQSIIEVEFINLGWEILYHKCLYYGFAHEKKYDFLRISDKKFDNIQKKYEELAKILKKKPTATNQVGFDKNSGSGTLVLSKILLDFYNRSQQNINVKSKQKKI